MNRPSSHIDLIPHHLDLDERFVLPAKLYGRTTEIVTLLHAFECIATQPGHNELMLVAGPSGVGKTALMKEFQKNTISQPGYFIQGKFDQFNRNIPLSAFGQALRDLIGQLLSEDEAKLGQWRSQILAAVEENGQILIEVIPDLAKIIGPQPVVSKLAGTAEQNRFNWIFKKFIEVFTTAEHPLVLFLDDLQWVDNASLQLIQLLMTGKGYLLLLGAYRDNEVSTDHPLTLMLNAGQQKQMTWQTIYLAPLTLADTNQLVATALHCAIERAQPLTTLIHLQTQGNPFFTTQFLKALQADGELRWHPTGYWECDITRLQSLSFSDDVVQFMAAQLQKLPIATQDLLKLAACIGNQFELDTLAAAMKQSYQATAKVLGEALQVGLVLPHSQICKLLPLETEHLPESKADVYLTYRFLHDRVQQAAYSLIPKQQRQQLHLKIGRLLYANTPEQQQKDKIFEIVNHYNLAMAILTDPTEKLMLVELNLRAAQKARATIAYHAAMDYAQAGIDLLGPNAWFQQYSLKLVLQEILADAAFLAGAFQRVPDLVQVVLDHAKSALDRVPAYETIIHFHAVHKRYQKSITYGIEILQQLGVNLSLQPNKLILLRELLKTKAALGNKSNQALFNLPQINNAEQIAPLRILEMLQSAAYFCSPELMALLGLVGLQLTLRYGNSPWAASFYATYCIVLSNSGELQQSYRMGQLAITLADYFGNLTVTSRIKLVIPWYSQSWQEPLRATIPILEKGLGMALASANLQYIGFHAYVSVVTMFHTGISLDEITARLPQTEEFIIKSKDENSQQFFKMIEKMIANLHSQYSYPTNLIGDPTQEQLLVSQWQANNEIIILSNLYHFKTILAYHFEDIDNALIFTNMQLSYEYSITGGSSITRNWMFDSLTRLAAHSQSTKQLQKQLLHQVQKTQKQLWKRAKLMPSNFRHQYDLVAAEEQRILQNTTAAIDLYDRAIRGAKAHKFIQEEALANELAAKFYLGWGKRQIAKTYMQEARDRYYHWGAIAKTTDLEQRYSNLLNQK
jgi:predicted ATPase